MTLDPILTASTATQLHVCAALIAIATGAFALFRPRRDRLHKIAGYIWITVMVVVAASTAFMTAEVGPSLMGYGVIHILSVVVIVSLVLGLRAAIARNIPRHMALMRALYVQSLGIAGLFTLLPGRKMNAVLFGDRPELGWAVIAIGGAWIAWMSLRPKRARVAT